MKNTMKLCLSTALLLGMLASCGTDTDETPQNTDNTLPQNQSTSDQAQSQEETPEPFALPEHYAHINEDIAKAFVSVQNTPDFIYVPNMPLDALMLEEMYGISPEMYSDFYGEVPMMSQQADQLIIFKTEDTASLVTALEDYLSQQRANLSQYSVTLNKLEVAVVGEVGDYVILNMLSSYPENEASFNEAEMMAFYGNTIATISAEIHRVLEGGEPLPYLILDSDLPEEGEEEAYLGEYYSPQGQDSDHFADVEHTGPATPPEGDEIDPGIMVPPMGESTGGHDPSQIPEADLSDGNQAR